MRDISRIINHKLVRQRGALGVKTNSDRNTKPCPGWARSSSKYTPSGVCICLRQGVSVCYTCPADGAAHCGATPSTRGVLAHLVERFHGMEEASGSNPLYSTTTLSDCSAYGWAVYFLVSFIYTHKQYVGKIIEPWLYDRRTFDRYRRNCSLGGDYSRCL